MKLFTSLSAMAVVTAQFNDFANLNDLFASLTADLAAPPAAASVDSTTTENNNEIPEIVSIIERFNQ